MIVYILIATLIFFGVFVNNKQYINIMLVILFAFTALHNPYITGTDGISYRYYFSNSIPVISRFNEYSHSYEIGYAFLNSVAKTIKDDYFIFQVIYCAISTFLLGVVLKKTKFDNNEKCLLLFVYFCFRYFQNSMEFLRQNIATLLVWIAILSIDDDIKQRISGKIKKYLLVIIGWSFHRSAIFNIIMIPLIDFLKKISTRKLLLSTAIISVIFLSLGTQSLNRIINIAVLIGGERYAGYLIDGTEYLKLNMINFLFRWSVTILYTFALSVKTSQLAGTYDLISYEFKESDLLRGKHIFVLSCIAVMCGSINVGIFGRLMEYYMIGIYMAVVKCKEVFSVGKSRMLFLLFIYVAFMILLIRNLHTVSGGTYMNYELYPF
jgi:hypothetical protein